METEIALAPPHPPRRATQEPNTDAPDALRSYLTHARTEIALRLCDRVYPQEQVMGADGEPTGQLGPRSAKPSKWWMSFLKRRFMGRSLDA